MNKKTVLIFLILFTITLFIVSITYFEPVVRQKIFKKMTVNEFLHEKNTNRWSELYLNKDGNVEYKNMVIIRDNDHKIVDGGNIGVKEEIKILHKSGWYRNKGVKLENFGL